MNLKKGSSICTSRATGQIEKTHRVDGAQGYRAHQDPVLRATGRLGENRCQSNSRGRCVSDKGDKTVIVKVERTFLHPVLKKTVRRSKKYHAHDEANTFKTGEIVRIIECAPKSKTKTWEVLPSGGAAQA